MNKQQLASKIWATANELRSKIKANNYKDYILGFMFYKYLSDKEEDYIFKNGAESLEDLNDDSVKEMIQSELGYFISKENLFSTWKTIGLSLGAATVSNALIEFNRNIDANHKKVFENIFSTLQNGLSELGENTSGSRDKAVRDIIDLIEDIPTTNDTYDVLGYIYEYLIYKFSTAAKDDGAFYTPHEVSSLISLILSEKLKDRDTLDLYDPTSGSGSLLFNMGVEASKYIDKKRIKYYGQEKITETYQLTRMNLIMKNIEANNIFIRNGDTLEDDWPYFDEQTSYEPLWVDAVVSNPPYSLKWKPEERTSDPRFKKYGLAPSGKADYAFLLHCLYHLKPDGVMGIVLPHGVLFRGATEGEIRRNLIENHNIETIIGLPSNLFFATGIPTIIMVLKKQRTESDVLFIDASQNFAKNKTQNVLRDSDIKRIFDAVMDRKDIPKFARLVSKEEIINNDYNLNIPRYISASENAESYDLYSVMSGEINEKEINKFDLLWNTCPSLKNEIFSNTKPEYCVLKDNNIKDIVLTNKDLLNYKNTFKTGTLRYADFLVDTLIKNVKDTNTFTKQQLIEKLFEAFAHFDLIDKYDLYQKIADKWTDIDNDLITIRENGLSVCKEVEPNIITKKNPKTKKFEDFQNGYKGKVIPFELIKSLFFNETFEKLNNIENEINNCIVTYTEIFENLEEDVLQEVSKEDKSAFDNKLLKTTIKNKTFEEDVTKTLQEALNAIDKEKELGKKIKSISIDLENKVKEKIEQLTEEEIFDLLVEKWVKPIVLDFYNVFDNTIKGYISKIESLNNKYSNPLYEIDKEIEETNKELVSLMDELTGSDIDMLAIQMLKEIIDK